MRIHPLDGAGSFAWLPHPGELLRRASTAVRLEAGWLLVDPLDDPGLDEALAGAPVAGVTVLMPRHRRDADAIAARHGVAVGPAPAEAGPRTVLDRPAFRESALWLADRGLLVCGDALGTAGYFLSGPGDPIGVHPLVRPFPPRRALRGLRPAMVAVGHGAPLTEGAADGLDWALRTARRRIGHAWAYGWRVGRAARRGATLPS
jgi:hypothetical protein